MSKLAEQLRAAKIYNNFEMISQFGKGFDVVVEYHARLPGRLGSGMTDKTEVWSVKKVPGLEPARMSRTYSLVFIGKRSESLPKAKAWVSTELVRDLVPSPFGGYVPKAVVDRAKDFVRSELSKVRFDPGPNAGQPQA